MASALWASLAFGLLVGGCSPPPSSSTSSDSAASGFPSPSSISIPADVAAKVRDCQAKGSSCNDACDATYKLCLNTPSSGGPPSNCGDDMLACKDTCLKDMTQCEK